MTKILIKLILHAQSCNSKACQRGAHLIPTKPATSLRSRERQSYGSTSESWLCQSDDDRFTIIDFASVIPDIRERLEQRFTAQALALEPFYVSVIKQQVDGDKIPTSLNLIIKIITANDFFHFENQQGGQTNL